MTAAAETQLQSAGLELSALEEPMFDEPTYVSDVQCARIEQRGDTLCAVLMGDWAEMFLMGTEREYIADKVWPALADHAGPKSIVACGLEWAFLEASHG